MELRTRSTSDVGPNVAILYGQSRVVTVHDPSTLAELGRVEAGGQDASIVAAAGAVWISTPDRTHIDRVDPVSLTLAGDLSCSSAPTDLVAGPDGTLVFAGKDDRVHLVDATSGAEIAASQRFGQLRGVVAPQGSVWAMTSGDGPHSRGLLVQLSPTDLSRLRTIDLPDLPLISGLRAAGDYIALLAMTEPGSMGQRAWNATTGEPASPGLAGTPPTGLAQNGDRIWLARDGQLQLVSADTRQVLARASIPGPVTAAGLLAHDRLWVCNARRRDTWNASTEV